MKIRFLLIAAATMATRVAMAQDDERVVRHKEEQTKHDYTLSKINPELLKGADAIVRDAHTIIDIQAADEVHVTEWYAITILNEHGDRFARLEESHDRHRKITGVQAWLYDKNNENRGRLKKAQLVESSYTTDAFFDEIRTTSYDFGFKEYPYTVVYKIEKDYKTTFLVPAWYPQPGYDCSVEKADIRVTSVPGIKVNYRMVQSSITPTENKAEDGVTIKATVKDLKVRDRWDMFSDVEKGYLPCMQLTCDQVVLGEYTGNLTTWKDWGTFVYKVNADRDKLPDGTVKMVHAFTDTCTSAHSKVAVLYRYLQQNTRYVNIMLGIGGWQAMEAGKVAEKGYGDCKGLANYMKALLKETGIVSNLVLVEGDVIPARTMDDDHPYHAFNHMILCVPLPKDTLWLDCTSKHDPAGYLAAFTSNRKVLMLTDNGGIVARTPAYAATQNRISRSANITINEKGEWNGTVNAIYSGYWWDMENHVLYDTKKEVSDYFNAKLQLATYSVGDYSVTNRVAGDNIPYLNEQITFSGSGNISKAGSRMFFSPRIFGGVAAVSESTAPRVDSFRLQTTYQVADTTTITLSGTFDAEKVAKDIDVEHPFGSFHSKASFTKGNELRIVSVYTVKSGRYAPALFADYQKMARMFNSGAAYDKVVLNKKG